MSPRYGAPLTSRELRVLWLSAQGLSTKQVAKRLFITEATVKTHHRRLALKLGAANRTHAVALGFQLRLLVPGRPVVLPVGQPARRRRR